MNTVCNRSIEIDALTGAKKYDRYVTYDDYVDEMAK